MPTPVLTPQRRLIWARSEKGFSQEEIANRLGVSVKSVGNWERGAPMPPALFHAWAAVCEVDYDWLIGQVPTPSEPARLERRRRARRTPAGSDQGVPVTRWTEDDSEEACRIHDPIRLVHAA